MRREEQLLSLEQSQRTLRAVSVSLPRPRGLRGTVEIVTWHGRRAKEAVARALVHAPPAQYHCRACALTARSTMIFAFSELFAFSRSSFLLFPMVGGVGVRNACRAQGAVAKLAQGRGEAAMGRAACAACRPCSSHREKVRARMATPRSSRPHRLRSFIIRCAGHGPAYTSGDERGRWSATAPAYPSDSSCRCSAAPPARP